MKNQKQADNIRRLMDRYLDHMASDRNRENLKLWKNPEGWNRDMWRGVPKAGLDVIPFLIAPDNSLWSKMLDIDMCGYYESPYTYLEAQLRKRIYQFEHFVDNTPLTDELYLWFSVVTELSFFGVQLDFVREKEPWIIGNVIEDEDDLDRMQLPDFYKSGLMPRIHEFYEVMSELADGRMKVMFPEFSRGPFCIAAHLRGFENALMDMLISEDFFLRLMRFVTDSYLAWMDERGRFMKEAPHPCKLYNDEINSPMVSPELYRDLIFPFEKELGEHFGGVKYWHSCGNTTPFLEQINKLPNLALFHTGPLTSYEDADRIMGARTTLDVNLDPTRDVLHASEAQMEEKLRDIAEKCRHKNLTVRIDNLMPDGSLETQLDKIAKWQDAAARVLALR